MNVNEIASGMKKLVAITLAGAAAALVATWRKARRESGESVGAESEIAMEPGIPLRESPPEPHWASVSAESSKAELYEVAKELDIEGRSKMTKDELLRAIRAAR